MTNKLKAFPNPAISDPQSCSEKMLNDYTNYGMDLRDYFAGKALQGLMANPERYKYIASCLDNGSLTQDQASEKNANKAYKIADAMMKARDK